MSTPCASGPLLDLSESRRTYNYFLHPRAQRLTPDNRTLSSFGAPVLRDWVRAHPQTAAIDYPELG